MSTVNLHKHTPTVIVKPILYGNIAEHLGSKRNSDGHTHKWKLYVRSFDNDDLSKYINRIQFRLHETYENNIRVVNQPPFEIEETGWGEFEIQITIFFSDPYEKPVIFYYNLKLFSTDPNVVTGKTPFINEYYDELVFQEPSQSLSKLLNTSKIPSSCPSEESQFIEKKYAMTKLHTMTRMKNVHQQIRNEIQDLAERLRLTQANVKRIRQRLTEDDYTMHGRSKSSEIDDPSQTTRQ